MEVLALSDDAVDVYADILGAVTSELADSNFAGAVSQLRPIAGERWGGKFSLMAPSGPVSTTERRSRAVSDKTRAAVFVRDGFSCTYCGGRTIPRCILVAISDVFPEAFAYHPNYKRGAIHPAFWVLAPEVDHALPLSQGGTDDPDNLTTLHTVCNARKSAALLHELPVLRKPVAVAGWDGLMSRYEATVLAGAERGERHSAPGYHPRWLKLFKVLP